MLISADNVVIKGLAFTAHDPKVTANVAGTERTATVILTEGDNFEFSYNYVISGKGIVIEAGNSENFTMNKNFFNWTTELGATGAWAWRPIRLDGKITNLEFNNNKVIQTADDDTSAGLYDILYVQTAAGTVNINNNNLYGYSYNWNFNIASAKEVTELNFNYNYVDGVVNEEGKNSGNTTLNVGAMGNATNANYIGNVVNTAGTTFSYDVADEAAYAGLITVTGNKFYSEAYKPRIKKAIKAECVVVKDNYIKAGAVTATGSFAFTMDGNLTDEAAFDALAYEAAKEYKANKFAAGYVNGTHVYIATKYQFNAYYEAEVALKYDVASDSYVVVKNEQNCTLAVGEYDVLLAVHDACADKDAAAIVKALKAGDKVKLSASFAEITGYAKTTDIDVTVSVYAAK